MDKKVYFRGFLVLHLFQIFAIIRVLNKQIKLVNMNIYQYLTQLKFLEDPKIFFPMLVWIIFWKGMSLWKSSQRKERVWFWLLMCINTLGILEICYLFVFSNPKNDLKAFKEKLMKNMSGKKIVDQKEEITIEPIEENTTNQE